VSETWAPIGENAGFPAKNRDRAML
jgi:hypothetical protein